MTRRRVILLFVLAFAALAAVVLSCVAGTTDIAVADVFGALKSALTGVPDDGDAARAIVCEIRLPRAVAALLCGAALGSAGAALQGLFRNPLADPGLIGVSSGGSLGALLVFAFAGEALARVPAAAHAFALPLAAMAGALAVTLLVLALSGTLGRMRVGGMLLVGIAVNSAISAVAGLILHFSADSQIRTYLFWMLGGLDRAGWRLVAPVALFTLAGLLALPRFARDLDVLALGEAEAHFAGVNVKRLQRAVVWISAGMVGAAVAIGGMIGFVGLVVPHAVRRKAGPRLQRVFALSALVGGAFLMCAEFARRLLPGADVPVGVVCAILGAPFFLWLLVSRRNGEGWDV